MFTSDWHKGVLYLEGNSDLFSILLVTAFVKGSFWSPEHKYYVLCIMFSQYVFVCDRFISFTIKSVTHVQAIKSPEMLFSM